MRLNPPGRYLRRLADDLRSRLPEADGLPIRVSFVPNLHSHRGSLLSEDLGQAVHGASDLRKREMFLDRGLQARPRELRRILIHEIFHFVWARLSNATRTCFEEMLASEFQDRARGELGWSAEYRKEHLRHLPISGRNARLWREYACESFCDTAAWFFSGLNRHEEFTLSLKQKKRRARWFTEYFGQRKLSI